MFKPSSTNPHISGTKTPFACAVCMVMIRC